MVVQDPEAVTYKFYGCLMALCGEIASLKRLK